MSYNVMLSKQYNAAIALEQIHTVTCAGTFEICIAWGPIPTGLDKYANRRQS